MISLRPQSTAVMTAVPHPRPAGPSRPRPRSGPGAFEASRIRRRTSEASSRPRPGRRCRAARDEPSDDLMIVEGRGPVDGTGPASAPRCGGSPSLEQEHGDLGSAGDQGQDERRDRRIEAEDRGQAPSRTRRSARSRRSQRAAISSGVNREARQRHPRLRRRP